MCDGPPSRTAGGRYGLLPVCASRLARATILVDDADRADELAVMKRWETEFGTTSRIVPSASGSYAIITPAVAS